MSKLKFKCTLISDVILNVKAATEGNNETLDFIPGSNFLGIVAGKLYDSLLPEESQYIFHSGSVRFGDAHPMADGFRALRTPAALFYPKLEKPTENCFVHHHITDFEVLKSVQLKQCRGGFYCFHENKGFPAQVNKSFAIKSAYDRNSRRSKDEAMYGYESIDEGTEFCFTIETDSNAYDEAIKKALCGKRRIGRSRTAQYGLVMIEPSDFSEIESKAKNSDGFVTVYADSRLIFMDEFGQPTFQPTPVDLGINEQGAEILWEKSQIRTFQYAPWNYTRQSHDCDRCGIEKGSVFIVKSSSAPSASQYVGCYNNEGFGKVIYNPEFLATTGENGKALFALQEPDKTTKNGNNIPLSGSPLLEYLSEQKKRLDAETSIYKKVDEFIKSNKDRFRNESFASQWGSIRSIAMRNKNTENLEKELFTKKMTKNGKEIPFAYLTHGVAADKWSERGRKKAFEDFFKSVKDMFETGDYVQFAVINIASEMAKICRKENKK
jgi:hypothetical protein